MPSNKKQLSEQFSKKNIERRFFLNSDFRVSDDGKKIVGYAAKFDDLAPITLGFREKIAKGAFTKTIKEADIRALFNHNPDKVLGRNKAGTLELKEDKTGLFYEITPPNTTYANDLKESISRGDISNSSFAFKVIKDLWTDDEEKGLTRELLEVKLFDVSPVTYPWYPTTEAGLRAQAENMGSEIRAILIKAVNNVELKTEEKELIIEHVNNLSEPQTLQEVKSATWKYCICTCGYSEEKTAGNACKLIKCPDCGKELTGSNEKPKSKKSEPPQKHSEQSEEPPQKHSKVDDANVLRKKLDIFEFESQA